MKLTRITLSEIQRNLGATLTIRRLPGEPNYHAFLTNTGVKKKGAKNSGGDHISCSGIGDTPSKAYRNLARKLRGKVLYSKDDGPCRNGEQEMVILGEVLPL